ncbi:MAG: DUF1810 domain-containing protein [Alloprevotella sp.]|nr:DUF1810 domain-containing protein [Alloprevotella sp.]
MDTELERFIKAQENDYARALEEIQAGRKRSHWIWYVFPQLRGLGRSAMADYYGLADRGEAERYALHPLLGSRLREVTSTLLALPEILSAVDVLGDVDAVKVRSCMTLFAAVTGERLFRDVLVRFYGGQEDGRTLQMLSADRKD